MLYKKLLILCCFILLSNCTATNLTKNKISNSLDNPFINKGFSLIYSDKFYDNKIISKKIDERSLVIFQKNLKKDTLSIVDIGDSSGTHTSYLKKLVTETNLKLLSVNLDLKAIEKIKNFSKLEESFSAENNMHTPTLKIKRYIIKKNIASLLNSFYKK